MAVSVSLIMIVRNEAGNLAECLRPVADLFQEVVIADTGSTDDTQSIARQFGARIVEFPWINDFSAARNHALLQATGDWVFWLDADDRIDAENRTRLQRLLNGLDLDAAYYLMRCLSPISTAEDETILEHPRLFRRLPGVAWKNRVHEQITPALMEVGAIGRASDVVIRHLGYQDPAQQRAKHERNRQLLELDLTDKPDDPATLLHLGWTWHLLGNSQQSLPVLQRFLRVVSPELSLTRKAFHLVIRGLRSSGSRDEAWQAILTGKRWYPLDPELWFHEAQMLKEQRDFDGAEACLLKLLQLPDHNYPAVGDDVTLRGYKGHCALAEVYREAGKFKQAVDQYRYVLQMVPDYEVVWVSLTDLLLSHQQWRAAEQLAQWIATRPNGASQAQLMRARAHMFRREFPAAKQLTLQVIQQSPSSPWPLEVLCHILNFEGQDWPGLERVCRQILALQPHNGTAQAGLRLSLQKQGR